MVKHKRVLTGMRTTGRLHLGHYVGALISWLSVQDTGEFECFFLLADTQALTTHPGDPEALRLSVRDVVLDWLSVGLDPTLPHVHFVLQSMVPERNELEVLLSQIALHKEVMRNKTLQSELAFQQQPSMGFVNYPVSQAADILMVSPDFLWADRELLVPVGRDQESHLELQRVLARRFNRVYGQGKSVLQPCAPLFSEIGRLVGTDGSAKMSKSSGNVIRLSDSPEIVEKAVMKMFTDPKRTRSNIPGDASDANPVFMYHRAFNDRPDEVEDLASRYEAGTVGDVEVKRCLYEALERFLGPIRKRRAMFDETAKIGEIVEEGTEVARIECARVVESMRAFMGISFPD